MGTKAVAARAGGAAMPAVRVLAARGRAVVLSDGSTDEVFSNLGYGDLGNVERVTV